MRYKYIQRELCIRPGTTSKETLKSALLQERGAQTASNLQKQLGYPTVSAVSPIKCPIRARVRALSRSRRFLCKGKSCRIGSIVAAVVVDCVVVDNRIAIPNCLQKPLLARLHRSHAVQLALVDAAQYFSWPRMHRDIIQLCKGCPQCTKFGKNLKANTSFKSTKALPLLSCSNEELKLDYAVLVLFPTLQVTIFT